MDLNIILNVGIGIFLAWFLIKLFKRAWNTVVLDYILKSDTFKDSVAESFEDGFHSSYFGRDDFKESFSDKIEKKRWIKTVLYNGNFEHFDLGNTYLKGNVCKYNGAVFLFWPTKVKCNDTITGIFPVDKSYGWELIKESRD